MDMPERYLIAAERAGMVLRMRGVRLRGSGNRSCGMITGILARSVLWRVTACFLSICFNISRI